MNHSERHSRGFLGMASVLACSLMIVVLGRQLLIQHSPTEIPFQQPEESVMIEHALITPSEPVPLNVPEIHNVWLIGQQPGSDVPNALYSGASPDTPEAFSRLKELGVSTIISVDGTKPDFETARKFGMTYVHAPIPYSGIEPEIARELGQFVQHQPGTIYVHCHHGKHRGPAAAAICARALNMLDPQKSQQFMKHVGTDPHYSGLWRDVAEYVPPASDDRPVEFKHVQIGHAAKTDSLVDSMVRIDHLFELLTEDFAADTVKTESFTDECTTNSLLLAEEFTEAARQLETQGAQAEDDRGSEFLTLIQSTARTATELHNALKSQRLDDAKSLFGQVKADCKSCHTKYRDQ